MRNVLTFIILLLSSLYLCIASPLIEINSRHVSRSNPRPLVLWHGLGDSYGAPGILRFIDEVKKMHPGIFVYSVRFAESQEDDRKASFLGNVNVQVENATEQIRSQPELADGFDAIGFSQAGQFLRAYVERSNSPPVHNLITFGSQHMGISDLPACKPFDIPCQLARRAVRGGVYSEWAQNNVISAQYYRDPDQISLYLERNHFLPDVNNEDLLSINSTYAENLKSLNKLVLVMFSQDKTVVPKESSWFGSYSPQEDRVRLHLDGSGVGTYGGERTIIPMRSQPLYVNDTIGLRTIDERGDLVFQTCESDHMDIEPCWRELVEKYIGSTTQQLRTEVAHEQIVMGFGK
ncbi:alpha/beta-hydrolase [Irpex rosettiformis]|uniref:Alpha/beta-hydrolase n=1 Tax=Irpex rosettiformis TaxID=378272 RepID=A0ACB8UG22_9APHY|nr:alpha/beta-hydrolase [Irpex rosettiformis]